MKTKCQKLQFSIYVFPKKCQNSAENQKVVWQYLKSPYQPITSSTKLKVLTILMTMFNFSTRVLLIWGTTDHFFFYDNIYNIYSFCTVFLYKHCKRHHKPWWLYVPKINRCKKLQKDICRCGMEHDLRSATYDFVQKRL